MTGEHDMDDVPEHLIPEEQVEAILSGEDAGAELSEVLASVAAVLGRAQQPPSPVEQLEANAAIATIVEVRRAARDELTSRRTRMVALHVSVSDLDQHDARISRRREGTDGDRTAS